MNKIEKIILISALCFWSIIFIFFIYALNNTVITFGVILCLIAIGSICLVVNQYKKTQIKRQEANVLEENYQKALNILHNANTIEEYQEAFDCFVKCGFYKDSELLRDRCCNTINKIVQTTEARKQEEYKQQIEARKKEIESYIKGKSILETADKLEDYQCALQLFKEAGSYKDADSLCKHCLSMVNEIKENYQKGIQAMSYANTIEEYQEAINYFTKCKKYLDSEYLQKNCKDIIYAIEQEIKEKEEYENLLKQCKELLDNKKAISPEDFFEIRKNKIIDEFTGVYVIYNIDKDMYYVGQATRIIFRVNQHFTGRGNGDVYADYKYGDSFTIRLLPLSTSGYDSLDRFEKEMIDATGAYINGYNKTQGNN